MRILVTGASGYIGRHLIPKLLQQGHELWGTYRHSPIVGIPAVRVDWTSDRDVYCMIQASVRPPLRTPPDAVIHLAGRVEISLKPNPQGANLPPVPGPCDIGALYRDNVVATANVLDYCLKAGVKHLIFASTQAVYGMGKLHSEWGFDEVVAVEPLEHYATSKLAAENVLEIGRQQGLSISTLRLPGVYGGDRKNGAIYTMCRDAVRTGVVTVTVPHPLPISVMHIEDVVSALVTMAEHEPKPFPFGISGDGDNLLVADTGCTMDVSDGEPCGLSILAEEIATLSGGRFECRDIEQPRLKLDTDFRTLPWLHKPPKSRKERLAQVLEEIRREQD